MGLNDLERLVRAAEQQPELRRQLRRAPNWRARLRLAQQAGYAITAADLAMAQREHNTTAFLQQSWLAPIRTLAD